MVHSLIFRKNLEAFMHERDLTQKEFAALLETTETTVSNGMRGKSSPTLDSLVNIAVKTGYSTDKLIGHLPPGLHVLEKAREQAGRILAAINSLLPDEGMLSAAAQEVAEQERTATKKKGNPNKRSRTKRTRG